MSAPSLTARDVAALAVALEDQLRGGVVRGVTRIVDNDDLILFLLSEETRYALHIAPGGTRARVTLTSRRFPKHRMSHTGLAERIGQKLTDTQLVAANAIDGSRALSLHFHGATGNWTIHVELFGPRGLWALCDANGLIVALSRRPTQKDRELEVGKYWQFPTVAPAKLGATAAIDTDTTRFDASSPRDLLRLVDEHFCAIDQSTEIADLRGELGTALARAQRREADRRRGLEAQLRGIAAVPALRESADMLLAMAHALPPDAAELRVPAPLDPTREIVVVRDVSISPIEQAQRIYEKARRLDASRSVTEGQLAELAAQTEAHERLAGALLAAGDDEPALLALRDRFAEQRLLPPSPKVDAEQQQRKQKLAKITRGENFRRFRSHDGNLILVGRDNAQNDRLSIKVARGNDLWCHVGRGYAGSHVVVRLERGREAGQETMLDAGTLALHFSKVRGTAAEEVIFTTARNVKKPKGLPPGKVVATQTRALRIRMEADRLARLLDSASEE